MRSELRWWLKEICGGSGVFICSVIKRVFELLNFCIDDDLAVGLLLRTSNVK